MATQITKRRVAKNIVISVTVQIISMAVSFLLALIAPRFIDEYQYSYWQTYVLYVGYVGILHFGLLDGIVLRYSQYDYDELDKGKLRSQFQVLLVFTSILAAVAILVAVFALQGIAKSIVIFVAIGIISKNIVTYISYSFQITNRINQYAIFTVIQRVTYGIVVVVLLACGVNDFVWYCLADLMGDAVAIITASFFNRGMYFGKRIGIKDTFTEVRANICTGINLLVANWAAMFIVGGAKMIVQWTWDELTFGKVSFAFSLSNVFLAFISAASIVLFPSLKRMEKDKLPAIYEGVRGLMSPLLISAMILYFPGCWILSKWLPAYSASLGYLGLMLPIIVFSSKINLLTNNYLKAYRKEKSLLIINVSSFALMAIIATLGAFVFHNLELILLGVVFTLMVSSITSEIVVLKTIRIRIILPFILEVVMTILFILCATFLNLWIGCAVYAGALLLYLLCNIGNFKKLYFRKKSVKEEPTA